PSALVSKNFSTNRSEQRWMTLRTTREGPLSIEPLSCYQSKASVEEFTECRSNGTFSRAGGRRPRGRAESLRKPFSSRPGISGFQVPAAWRRLGPGVDESAAHLASCTGTSRLHLPSRRYNPQSWWYPSRGLH